MKYACIICENGDPYSNIVCDKCEESIEHMKDVNEAMIALVHDRNNIVGNVPIKLSEEIIERVKPLFEALINIKIYR